MRPGQKRPKVPGLDEWAGVSLYETLSSPTPHETDRAWFERRWTSGERDVMEAHAKRVVEEASSVPMGPLGGEDSWEVFGAPVMGNCALAHGPARRIVVGPRCAGITLCLALVAEQLRPLLKLDALSHTQQEMVRLHVGGAALFEVQDEETALDSWLPDLVEAILPRPSEQDAYQEDVVAVADLLLDQPPGEIERIAIGLSQRRIPRLLRAWRRGFFVPPGFQVTEWVKSL